MKYEQPYGISDPNASYINGNPSTGTMGSIPPAASIEFPQREIVNFITKSALTPTDADLLQLAKAVQAGLVNYGTDQGTPNQIVITPTVPITAYALGQRFVIKVKFGNTSQVTINVNGCGGVPLIHTDLSPINPYELIAGQLIEVAYDSANFQAIGGIGIGGAVLMTAPQNLYVNPTTGSDTLYDGTAPVISGISGPFQTIDKALNTMKRYNLGGWIFTINLADGVYTKTSTISCPLPNGSGTVVIQGNMTAPDNVSIFNTGTGSCLQMFNGGHYAVQGCSFRATAGNPGDQGHGIWVMFGTSCNVGKCAWNQVPANHLVAGSAASIFVSGDQYIHGGGIGAHQATYTDGVLISGIGVPTDPNLTITQPVTLGAFVQASQGGQIWSLWNSITGAANLTGQKYQAIANGVVNSGARGASALPGSAAGTVSTGGQYL